ncbi:MAG: hypothetical protein HQL55_00290 [Magnetococcales bacterium]|nr:hypothetical protein [Magnetococcales bacterium]
MDLDPANRAWVEVATPLSCPELWQFLQDIRRLLRLNPHWNLHHWQQENLLCQARLQDELVDYPLELSFLLESSPQTWTMTFHHRQGEKILTRFTLRPAADFTAILTIEDFYHHPLSHQHPRLDHSLIPWGSAIHGHLLQQKKYGWLPGYAWYMDRVHLAMAPRNRRLTRLLLILSLAEFIFFLGVLALYLLQSDHGP